MLYSIEWAYPKTKLQCTFIFPCLSILWGWEDFHVPRHFGTWGQSLVTPTRKFKTGFYLSSNTLLRVESSTGCMFRDDMGFLPITISFSFLKICPCKGFVKKSATMDSVGQYATSIFSISSLSFTQKYLISRCLVRRLLDRWAFFSRRIALWLSWYNILLFTL